MVTDSSTHHYGFLDDTDDACVVTSTDEAHQSTPDGANEGAHRTRARRCQLQLVARPDDAHFRDSQPGVRYGALEAVNPARRRESVNDVGALSNASGCEPSSTDCRNGRIRPYRRRRSSSSTDADDTRPELCHSHRNKTRTFDCSGSFKSFWPQFENCASTTDGTIQTSQRICKHP